MEREPLISIIVPTYNRQTTLPNTIQSIVKQIYTNWELIIIDDGSAEDIRKLVNDYTLKDQRIKYLFNGGNKGPAAARNNGIRNSNGEYIAFLDSDDEWFENHLNDSIKALLEENVQVCFALWWEKSSTGKIYKIYDTEWEKERWNEAINALNPIIHNNRIIFPAPGFFEFNCLKTVTCSHINSMVIKREVIQKVGLINEELSASEDLDFVDRIIHDYPFCLIKNYHFIYNQGEDNIHNFIDRRVIDMEAIFRNTRLVNKLTFCGIYKCKALELRKNLIHKSPRIKRKARCIRRCNYEIGIKYFTLAYINKKLYKGKAIYFLGQSLMYQFNSIKIKLAIHILLPGMFKVPNITLNDLWLH